MALAGAAVLTAAGSWLGWRLAGDLHIRQQQSAEAVLVDAARLLAGLAAGPDGPDPTPLDRAWAAARTDPVTARIYDLRKDRIDLEAVLTDRRGIVLWHSASAAAIGQDWSRWNDIARTLAGTYGARATRSDPDDPRTAVMHVAAPVRIGGTIAGVVSVAKPVAAWGPLYGDGVAQGWRLAMAAAAGAAVLLLLAAWWITAPLDRLGRWVARAARERTPPPDGPPEVRRLGAAFATMRDELADREGLERHVETLTHELKSPFTAIAAGAALLREPDLPAPDRDRLLDHLERESRRAADLADRLGQLARLDRGDGALGPIDAGAVVHETAAALAPTAAARGIALAVHAEGPLTLRGDAWWLGHAVRNLIDNALVHTPDGGAVRIDAVIDGDSLAIQVQDRGAGIPPWLRERLGQRFAAGPRPDGRRGTGLGLALVAAVAGRHRGAWGCDDRPGGGTVAWLRLPRA
ncbi:MAG: two-component system sensor histidine kinase CreC [Planctomycetota bacterium]|jgi:two-component system sensor histidine kinase CreC